MAIQAAVAQILQEMRGSVPRETPVIAGASAAPSQAGPSGSSQPQPGGWSSFVDPEASDLLTDFMELPPSVEVGPESEISPLTGGFSGPSVPGESSTPAPTPAPLSPTPATTLSPTEGPSAAGNSSQTSTASPPTDPAADALRSIAEILRRHPELLSQVLPAATGMTSEALPSLLETNPIPPPTPVSSGTAGPQGPGNASMSSGMGGGAQASAGSGMELVSGPGVEPSAGMSNSPVPLSTSGVPGVTLSQAQPSAIPQSSSPGQPLASSSAMPQPVPGFSDLAMPQPPTAPGPSDQPSALTQHTSSNSPSPQQNVSDGALLGAPQAAAMVDLVLASKNAPNNTAASLVAASTTVSPPTEQFDLKTAMVDPVFAQLMEAHIHQLMSQAGQAKVNASANSTRAFDLQQAMKDPVFVQLLEGHLHQLMLQGKALHSPAAADTTTTTEAPMANTTSGVANTTSAASSSSPTFSLTEAMKDPEFVSMMEGYINQVLAKKQLEQASTTPPPPTTTTTPPSGSTTTQSMLSVLQAFSKQRTSGPSLPHQPGTPSLPNPFLAMLSPPSPPPVVTSSLPLVRQSTWDSLEEVYYMLKYMKPTHPTVMGQIKFLLEVNPPRVRPNPATFTQVTAAQLREVRVPVVTPLQTQAMSSSINVLAKAYGLSVPQVLQLLKGKHPNQMARLITTPSPTQTTSAGAGGPSHPPPKAPSTHKAVPTPTTPPVPAVMTAEPTEAPEPGDPGFMQHRFPVGKPITAEDIMILQEMMAA